ncbi:MAG: Enoyl-CoA hydratase, partial [uncultured Rubrobacteraceae bacterium]
AGSREDLRARPGRGGRPRRLRDHEPPEEAERALRGPHAGVDRLLRGHRPEEGSLRRDPARRGPGLLRRPRPLRDGRTRPRDLPAHLRRLLQAHGGHPGNPPARHSPGPRCGDRGRLPARRHLRPRRRLRGSTLRHARRQDRPLLLHPDGRPLPRRRPEKEHGDAPHRRLRLGGGGEGRRARQPGGPGGRAGVEDAFPGGQDLRGEPPRRRRRQAGVLQAAGDAHGAGLRLHEGGDVLQRHLRRRPGGHVRLPGEAPARVEGPL